MNVLYVIYSIYGGGAEKQMQQILRLADRSKFRPFLAVFKLTGKEKEILPDDVPVYDLSTDLRPASLFLMFKLAGLIRKTRPERILSFMWPANLITLAAARISGCTAKVIISERTHLKFSILRHSFAGIRRFLVRTLYPKAEKIISVSRNTAIDLTREFAVPEGKISVIHNGVDIDAIKQKISEPANLQIGKPYILGAGGLSRTKNFPLLIKCFAGLVRGRNDLNLLILGEGRERASLEKLIAQLNLNGRVFLPGAVDNPYPCISRASAIVFTSLFEGFPNIVIEAMACRVPVICVPYDGIDEIIDDNKTGLISPGYDEGVLSSTVRKLLDDKALRETLIEAAYKKVADDFSVHKMMRRYEELLA